MRNETTRTRHAASGLQVDDDQGCLCLRLAGRLHSGNAGPIWRNALAALAETRSDEIVLDAEKLTYCDISGIALIGDLRQRAQTANKEFHLQNFPERYRRLLSMFPEDLFSQSRQKKSRRNKSFPEETGRTVLALCKDLRAIVAFGGELLCNLCKVLRHPGRVRWDNMLRVVETAGVNALPIILLIGFLLGLILSFQSAVAMSKFGAGIFVADLVALSLTRELGALITAIILAGRSGSSFAAELGTMKVNDEIDALVTMGLNPVFFLAIPRVLGGILVAPLLMLFSVAAGLVGSAIVVLSMGYPMATYLSHVTSSITTVDLLGGLFKIAVFGMVVSAVGCMRGLQTGSGAQAVGESTTSSVITAIVLIAVLDGIFAALFYVLGI